MSYLFKNKFRQKIESGKFVISAEINPNRKGNLKENLKEVSLFAPFVDVIDVTDSAMARARPSSFVVASLLQKKYDISTIFNYSCRDRNVIGMKSDLYGALILGLENILVMTGDHPSKGDHKNAKAVFEFSSVKLLELTKKIKNLSSQFFPGAVLNIVNKISVLEKNIERKKNAGARYIITQPVYSKQSLDNLKLLQEKYSIPILAGIMPMKSLKVAKFIKKNIHGASIPEDYYARIQDLTDEEIFEQEIEYAKNNFEHAKKISLAGVHFMPLGEGKKIPEIIGEN